LPGFLENVLALPSSVTCAPPQTVRLAPAFATGAQAWDQSFEHAAMIVACVLPGVAMVH